MRPLIKLYLKPGKEKPLKRFHLWVFSGAVERVESTPKDGDWVEIYSSNQEFLALGYYSEGSICARIISFEKDLPGPDLWIRKLNYAITLREGLGFFDNPHINMFRLVNAEGDNIPGLVVDFYNGVVVIQAQTTGMFQVRHEIAAAIREILKSSVRAIVDKSHVDNNTSPSELLEGTFGREEGGIVEIIEYGNRFLVDVIEGQKTGFFIDQRENRKLLQHFTLGKDVLNMFSYTGGFSVYAARGGARKVVSVDISTKATQLAQDNMAINGFVGNQYQTVSSDVFNYFNKTDQEFDCIVLDPPAFAKHQAAKKNAIRGYRNINQRAISSIRKGGILFTFSCSQLVSVEDFRTAVFSAAAVTGRSARLLHHLSQPPDHPVNIYHPEGEYLKGFVVAID